MQPNRGLATAVWVEYKADLADLAGHLKAQGVTLWQAVTLRDLQRYQAELDRRQLAPSSRNRKTYSIKTFFNFLVQSGYLASDPTERLIPPTIPQKERRFLSEDEYQSILAEAYSSRDKAILEVFLQTGLRLSELVHLTVFDLELPKRISRDPENVGLLKVRRKRAKEVVLPLNWKACEALAIWLRARQEIARKAPTTEA